MKTLLKSLPPFLLLFAVLALAGWYEWSLWHECRQTNSFFYCARVLSH